MTPLGSTMCLDCRQIRVCASMWKLGRQPTLCWQGENPRQFDSFFYGARSWGRKRRVVARIEVRPNGRDTRFIVTSLTNHRGKYLYEKLYCARGQLCPWSDRKPHQGLETPSRLRPHIMLKGQPQPDAANAPQLRLLADVDPVRHIPIASDQDRGNSRREEDTDCHVAARVMSTSKSVPPPAQSTRTTSQGMTRISWPAHPEPQTRKHQITSQDPSQNGRWSSMRGFQSKTRK